MSDLIEELKALVDEHGVLTGAADTRREASAVGR